MGTRKHLGTEWNAEKRRENMISILRNRELERYAREPDRWHLRWHQVTTECAIFVSIGVLRWPRNDATYSSSAAHQ